MVTNMHKTGCNLNAYDIKEKAASKMVHPGAVYSNPREIAGNCNVISSLMSEQFFKIMLWLEVREHRDKDDSVIKNHFNCWQGLKWQGG